MVPSCLSVAGQPPSQAVARPGLSMLRVCPSGGRGEGPGAAPPRTHDNTGPAYPSSRSRVSTACRVPPWPCLHTSL